MAVLKSKSREERKGLLHGIASALIPHIGCIAIIFFALTGITAGSVFFKKFLLVKWIFPAMVLLSLAIATLSAVLYLRRDCCQTRRSKIKYITFLFGSVLIVNIFMLFIIFPAAVNAGTGKVTAGDYKIVKLKVDIPCPGHAQLIKDELIKLDGVSEVEFKTPDFFDVKCDKRLSEEEILSLDIFKEFPGRVIK